LKEDVMRRAAIVGAGLIGRAWAVVFARAGWRAQVWDPDAATLASLNARCAAMCSTLARHGLLDDPDGTAALIAPAESMEAALDGAEIAQENGPERVEVKQALFAQMDGLAEPNALLASSTSAIAASRFTESLPGRHRCLVAHPVNPPHLIPLVELCGAPWTEGAAMERARATYAEVGQSPIFVRAEVEGFVLNRLQGALLAEAFRLVADGVVDPEDLDRTLTDGLARRWAFLGPFATIELNAPGGLPDYCARYTGFYRRLAADPPGAAAMDKPALDRVIAAWTQPADEARLADASARRDERLAALAAHLAAQAAENH
jgi:3-hydroxyacyl-CoA dehydrogenase